MGRRATCSTNHRRRTAVESRLAAMRATSGSRSFIIPLTVLTVFRVSETSRLTESSDSLSAGESVLRSRTSESTLFRSRLMLARRVGSSSFPVRVRSVTFAAANRTSCATLWSESTSRVVARNVFLMSSPSSPASCLRTSVVPVASSPRRIAPGCSIPMILAGGSSMIDSDPMMRPAEIRAIVPRGMRKGRPPARRGRIDMRTRKVTCPVAESALGMISLTRPTWKPDSSTVDCSLIPSTLLKSAKYGTESSDTAGVSQTNDPMPTTPAETSSRPTRRSALSHFMRRPRRRQRSHGRPRARGDRRFRTRVRSAGRP